MKQTDSINRNKQNRQIQLMAINVKSDNQKTDRFN